MSLAARRAAAPVAAFALGAASVLGFAPFALYPITLLTCAALVLLWRRAPGPGSAALRGFAFGWGFFLAGVSWVYVSLSVYGGMPPALALIATVLFCAYLALFPALAGAVFRRLSGHSLWRDALVAAGAWTLAEWLRGWLFTGFPWLGLGYAHAPPSPLAGFAPVLGVYGVSFAAMLAAAWIGLAPGRARVLPAGASVIVLLALGWALGGIAWTRPEGKPVGYVLLQGNIEQSLKWRPELLEHSLQTYLRLARAHPADVLVLPETAAPLTLDRLDPLWARAIAQAGGGAVLMGIVIDDGDGRMTNSAITFDGQRYDKSHLVPFGEFVPTGFRWTLSVLHIPMSDFARGAEVQPPLRISGQQVAVNICYEDLFGAAIARGAAAAGVLINLSNTAWFGDSLAQPQHLQIAQLRALETGRPMLRATNTGMTALVDARGQVRAALAPFTEDALRVQVIARAGATPYMRTGDGAVLAMALGALGLARTRGARRANTPA